MSLPEDSVYRDLFDNIPDDFLEDIISVRRTKTTEDSYGKPVFSEVQRTLRGRFQIIDSTDRIVEEGGVGDLSQARVFLKIPQAIEDQFLGTSLDLTFWKVLLGTPTVTGGYLFLDESEIIETILEYDLTDFHFKFSRIDGLKENRTGQIFIRNIGTGAAINFTLQDNIPAAQMVTQTLDGVGGDEFNFHAIPWVDGDDLHIVISPTEVVFLINEVVLVRHTTVIPTGPFSIGMSGGTFSPGVTTGLKFDYLTANLNGVWDEANETDQFIARDKRWSQMKAPLITHLQAELLVQEVTPRG